MRIRLLVSTAVLSLSVAGCSSVVPVGAGAPASATTPAGTKVADRIPAGLDRMRPPAIGTVAWQPLPTRVDGVPVALSSHPDAATWLLWMDPSRLRFRFVPGTKYPEGSPVRALDRRPSTWVPMMAAAFNGGFKLSDHVGGFFYDGRVVAPLRTGLASLVVGLDGSLRVLVWGRDISSTRGLLAVRQNLPPLVDHGLSMTRATDTVTTWGLPLHHVLRANRSALGVLPDGSLVYVYAHDAIPSELAATLVRLGVETGIALDMNSGWPAALVFRHTATGVSATRLSPFMHQYLDAYYHRTAKDFIAVLVR